MLRELPLERSLARIAEAEAEVRAWVEVAPQPPLGDGPLRGIPFGVKDIFETRGMATEYGSPLYRGRKGDGDAALVAYLRRRGAILLGKTQTAAFASFDPPPTRNPRYPGRTPGGSSSGSAAAVAAGMVPFALGTQTLGSVLRPASYCGVAGFKPTYGRLPMEGVLPFAPSLDTAGLFTRTAADMALLWELAGWGSRAPLPERRAAAWGITMPAPPGWRIEAMEPPEGFEGLADAARLINDYEGARTHRERWERHGDGIGVKLARLVESGLRIPEADYLAARECVTIGKQKMSALFREHPVVFTPAATGPAPVGLESTGDPRANAPWTALGAPAISAPVLPVGLQITAAWDREDLLLAAAVEVESCYAG